MSGSLITLPLRLTVRSARTALKATRDVVDLGLAAVELVAEAVGAGESPASGSRRDPRFGHASVASDNGALPEEDAFVGDPVADPEPALDPEPLAPRAEEPVDMEPLTPLTDPPHIVEEPPELVDEVADPGAEEGAGAQIRVDPPFAGYDELRAPDVIARLPSVDNAELAETELYERTHRARRTVLDAIARELRRR